MKSGKMQNTKKTTVCQHTKVISLHSVSHFWSHIIVRLSTPQF